MYQYNMTEIPDFITVQSLVTVCRSSRSGMPAVSGGESHAAWEFLYLEQGSMNVLVDGRLCSLQPGQLILYPPHSFHSVASFQNAVFDVVCFTASGNGLWEFCGSTLTPTPCQRDQLDKIIAEGKRLLELPSKGTQTRGMVLLPEVQAYQIQKLGSMLTLFLLDLYETDTSNVSMVKPELSNAENYRKEQLRVLTKYLTENISCNLTLDEISKACAISVPSLHKLCRSQCGCGPVTYFISLKLGAAKRLMRESSLNFTQISAQLGFTSVHYFSRLFKSKTGMSPSAYAKSMNR